YVVLGLFNFENDGLHVGAPAAAHGHRLANACISGGGLFGLPGPGAGDKLLLRPGGGGLVGVLCGMLGKPGFDFGAECGFLGGVVEIHGAGLVQYWSWVRVTAGSK